MKKQRNCAFCGRFFSPDVRVKDRQKSCRDAACQTKRRRKQEKDWLSRQDPGHFRGRYQNTKEWRQANPGYQKDWRDKKRREIQMQIRPETRFQSVRVHLRLELPLSEIQMQFMRVRQAGGQLWVDGALMHPT